MTEAKMVPGRATAMAWLRQALADEVDELMRANGFKRSARSVSYARAWGPGRQKVDFELIIRPRYAPEAVQVSLSASFVSAEIAAIARVMLPDDDAEIVNKDVVQRSVLDQIMRNPPVLKFTNEPESRKCVALLRNWVESSVVPYLNARDSIENLVRLDRASLVNDLESGFPRGHRPVVLAAMNEFLGNPGEALEMLDLAYPPGSQERSYYAQAFIALNGE
ncbi:MULTISPECIES: hypothetical protein [Streptomyces]|uniref:hypothetical protein n=1 Tax=Streptomyces TaxID=1883 RepID=UPI00117CED7F|nr:MULTISPECIES: hypothetical protein [Streptomyces]MDX2553866.1 hypothetical protein [Streptomyces stelliscabiei]MDX2612609.1 hypothetical protein [Streptomyces stelliscabiei]MDX2638347.1 hypothetical protein [Streptomyces stelliscabiei]MDX2663818.1 hypothetical protein [Streptomyces stelliscabiei]MDX2715395.1 hypothetical protein [Streptomyces stelliscabiei]